MNSLNNSQVAKSEVSQYATSSYFCRVFIENTADLHQLAFLLTADHQKAEQCFVAGLDDSIKSNCVFKEWAHSWAKRAIVENAIREMNPRPNRANSFPPGTVSSDTAELLGSGNWHFELNDVLALKAFDRFVFVMSAIEHYSEQDCILLLGCTRQELQEARTRAFSQLIDSGRTVSSGEILSETVREKNR